MYKRVDLDSMKPWKSTFIRNYIKIRYHFLNYAQLQKIFWPTTLAQMSSKMKSNYFF